MQGGLSSVNTAMFLFITTRYSVTKVPVLFQIMTITSKNKHIEW